MFTFAIIVSLIIAATVARQLATPRDTLFA